MSVKVVFGFLVFFVMYYNSERTLANYVDTQNLVDVLNAILSHKHWERITNVNAKLPDSTDQSYFSGKDIYTNRGLFSHNGNVGNSCVSIENVYEKYHKVISLTACIYAYVIDKFTKMILNLLNLGSNERLLSQVRASNACYKQKKRKNQLKNEASQKQQSKRLEGELQDGQSHGLHSDDTENDKNNSIRLHNDELTSYKIAWKVFNFTCQKLLNGQKMFKCMYDALSYLLVLVPRFTYFSHFITDVQEFLLLVKWYKDVSFNLINRLQTYVGEDDVDYKWILGQFSQKLSSSINLRKIYRWEPFVDKYCSFIVEDNQSIKKILQKFKKDFPRLDKMEIMDQFGSEIDELINNAIINYFLDLGFVFSFSDNLYD